MHGRIIDGVLVCAPGRIMDGNRVIYNPSAELLEAAGWMPIVETPYPVTEETDAIEDDTPQEMPLYAETWEEQDRRIVRVWVQVEPAEPQMPQPSEPPIGERVADLEGAVMELADLISGMLMGDEALTDAIEQTDMPPEGLYPDDPEQEV